MQENKLSDTIDDADLLPYIEKITGSESLCLAKFYNATIWLGSGQTTSCHHPLPHAIDSNEILNNPSAIHNTKEKKNHRKQMLSGEKPSGCEYCWKIESLNDGSISDRVYKTKIYSSDDLLEVMKRSADYDYNLKTLEISFDRTCQLACSYCNPAFSSTWVNDIKRNGPYSGLHSDGRNHYTHVHDASQLFKFGENNPYAEAFFRWWETDLHSSLIELRLTGGEPLMSGYTWKLIDWFLENRNRTKTRLAINTNLIVDDEKIHKLIELSKVVQLDIYTSCEAVSDKAEYVRDGFNWNIWSQNMHVLANSKSLNGLHIMATPSALSIYSITDFLDWCIQFKEIYGRDFPVFTLNILRFPSFQSILVLSDAMLDSCAYKLDDWFQYYKNSDLLHAMEKNHIKRLISYLKNQISMAEPKDKLRSDLISFIKQYDTRRNKSIMMIPEVATDLGLI